MIQIDNLAAIAENNPTIFQEIATHQGIPIAELKNAIVNQSLSPAPLMPFGKLILAFAALNCSLSETLEMTYKLKYAGYSGVRVAIEFNMR